MGTSLSKESLFSAIESGKYEGIKKILREDPQLINSPMTNDCKTTPLVRAAWRGDIPLIELLIELGADINFPGREGITALMWAAIRGRVEVINFIITNKADVNRVSEQGFHVLDYAIIYVHMDAAKLLFKTTKLIPKTVPDYNEYCKLKRIPRKNYHEFLDNLIKDDKLHDKANLTFSPAKLVIESYSSDNIKEVKSLNKDSGNKDSFFPKLSREESIISNLKSLLEYEDPSQINYDNTEEYKIEFENESGSLLKISKSSSKGKEDKLELDDLFLFE